MNPSNVWDHGGNPHYQGYAIDEDFGGETNHNENYEYGHEEENLTNSYNEEGYSYPQDGYVQDKLSSNESVEQPLPEGWVQYWTAEGWPYFYHAATDSSSWEFPTDHTIMQRPAETTDTSQYNINQTSFNSSSKSNESQHSMTLTYSLSPYLPNNTPSIGNQHATRNQTANADPFTPPTSELLDLNMEAIYQDGTPSEGAESGTFSRGIPGLVSSFPTAVTAAQFFSPLPEFNEHTPLSPDELVSLAVEPSAGEEQDLGSFPVTATDSVDLLNITNEWAEPPVVNPAFSSPGYNNTTGSEETVGLGANKSRFHISVDHVDSSYAVPPVPLSPIVLDRSPVAASGANTTNTTYAYDDAHSTYNTHSAHGYMLDNLEFSPASISEPAFTFNNSDHHPNPVTAINNHHSTTVPHTPYSSHPNPNALAMHNNSIYMSPNSPFSGESEIFKCLSGSNDNNDTIDQTNIDRSRSGHSVDGYNRSHSNMSMSIGERLEGGDDTYTYTEHALEPSSHTAQSPHTYASDTTQNTQHTHNTNTSFLPNSGGGKFFFSRPSDLDVAALISDDSGSDADAEHDVHDTNKSNSNYYGSGNAMNPPHYELEEEEEEEEEEGNPGDDFIVSYAPPAHPHPRSMSSMYSYAPPLAPPSQSLPLEQQQQQPQQQYSPPPPFSNPELSIVPLSSPPTQTSPEAQSQTLSHFDYAQSPSPTTHPAPSSQVHFTSPELVYEDIYNNNNNNNHNQLSPTDRGDSNLSTFNAMHLASPELAYPDIYNNNSSSNNLSPMGGSVPVTHNYLFRSADKISDEPLVMVADTTVFEGTEFAEEDFAQDDEVYGNNSSSHADYDAENAYLRSTEDPYSSTSYKHSHGKADDSRAEAGQYNNNLVYDNNHSGEEGNSSYQEPPFSQQPSAEYSNNNTQYHAPNHYNAESETLEYSAEVHGSSKGANYGYDNSNGDGDGYGNEYGDGDGDATPGPDPTVDPYDWYGANDHNHNHGSTNSSTNPTYPINVNQVQTGYSEQRYHQDGTEESETETETEPDTKPEPEHNVTTNNTNYTNHNDYSDSPSHNNNITTSMDPHEVAWLQYEQLRDSGALDNAPPVTPSSIDLSTIHRDNADYVSSSASEPNSAANSVGKESKYAKLRQSLTNKSKGNTVTGQRGGKGGMHTQQQQTLQQQEEFSVIAAASVVPVSHWVECVTGEGDVYYYNTVTEHVQWENPHEMPAVETISAEAGAEVRDVSYPIDTTFAAENTDMEAYTEPTYEETPYAAAPAVASAEQNQNQHQPQHQSQFQQYQQYQQQQPSVSVSANLPTSNRSVVSAVPSVTHSTTVTTSTTATTSAAIKTVPRKGMVTLNTVAVPNTSSNSIVSNSYQPRPYTSTTNTYAHSSNTSSVSALSRQAIGHTTTNTTSVTAPGAATVQHTSSQRRVPAEATRLQYPNSNVYPQLTPLANPAQSAPRYIPYPVQERPQMYEHVSASTYPQLPASPYSPGSEKLVHQNGESEQEGEESETDSTIHSPLARYMRHMPLGNRASTVSISSLSDNESTDFGYAGSVQGSVQGAFVISHGAAHGSPSYNNSGSRVLSPMYHPNNYNDQVNNHNTSAVDHANGEISPLEYPSQYEPPGTILSTQSDNEIALTLPTTAAATPTDEADGASQASSESQTQRHLEIWDRFFRNAFLVTQQADGQSQGDETKLTQASVTESIRKIRQKAAMSRSKGATAVARWPHTLSQRRYTALIDFALRRHATDTNSTHATPESDTDKLKDEEQALLDDHSANGSVTSIDGTLMSMALLAAVLHEDINAAERLLKNGANPSCVDDQIRTPAHYACRVGNVAILALLFDHDAELEATDAAGRTPLHTAAIFGRLEAMEFLLGCAVDSNSTDLAGNAPLHLAARAGFEDGCRLLLNFNASTLTRNLMGMTPLGVAQIMRPQSAALQAVVAMLSSPDQHHAAYGEEEVSHVEYEGARLQMAVERPSVRFSVGSGGSDSGGSVHGGGGVWQPSKSNNNMAGAAAQSVQSRVDSWRQQAASVGHQPTFDAATAATAATAAGTAQHNPLQLDYDQYQGTEYDHQGETEEPDYNYTDHNNHIEEGQDYDQDEEGAGEEDNEEEEEEGNSVADLVASSVWGVAASLIDITLSMFSNPNNDNNNNTGKARKDGKQSFQEEDSVGEDENYTSRPLRSLSQSQVHSSVAAVSVAAPARGSLWSMLGISGSKSEPEPQREESSDSLVGLTSAPPTDRELSERGLGFPSTGTGHSPPPLPPFVPTSPPHVQHPRSGIKIMTPPALVAREIGEHIARSASSTPQRDLPPTPPSEVMVAVALNKAEQMRLHAQQTQQQAQRRAPPPVRRSMMDEDGPSPPPLPLQLHGHSHGHGQGHNGQSLSGMDAFSGPSAGSLLHSGDDRSVGGSEQQAAAAGVGVGATTSPPTSGNGYSLGASLPRGVQWRYVDVLNKQT